MPPESDIVLNIDCLDAESSPARAFAIASNLIKSLEDLDSVLLSSVDSRIRTTLVLEELRKGSIKIFLRNILKQIDDQALKDLDWRPLIGQYLVRGKYAAIRWLDEDFDDTKPPEIEDLTSELKSLAERTDVRHLPDYPPPNPARLTQALDGIQRVKRDFKENEKLTITLGKDEYKVNLSSDWLPSEKIDTTKTEQLLANESDMVLVIRKPDFLGKSQWQFKHGKHSFGASIDDQEWINQFRSGDHIIAPGDALKVRVKFEHHYDERGNLLESKQRISKVLNVIKAAEPPKELFDED